MIASLPMYDRPELLWATDALWEAIANRLNEFGIRAPSRLTRCINYEVLWENSDLIMSMTCMG